MVNEKIAIDHGLKKEEYKKICDLLKRTPNITELGIFSAMWNEHCSYKSTRKWLRTLPTAGSKVICGPGENAGIIDIGDGIKIKMRYPTFDLIAKFSDTTEEEGALEIFGACIQTIYQGEESYESSDYSKKELDEFIESMSAPQAQALQHFFETLPRIAHTVKYKWVNPEDSNDIYEEDIEITGLLNFLS